MDDAYSRIITKFAGKRILITGSSGYLATNLAQALADSNCNVIRISGKNHLPQITGSAEFCDICADIRHMKTWKDVLEGVDIVYHFAAQTSVYKAEENPLSDLNDNVVPMIGLLEACKDSKRNISIVFSGTVTEHGIPAKTPTNESDPDRPVTIYDIHKLIAEGYLKHYARNSIVKGTTLRLSNVYGPGPTSSSADRGVINMMMKRAMDGGALTVYGEGNVIRDYIYINDVIGAFLTAGNCMERLNGNHYVIGSGSGHSISQAVNLIAERVFVKTGRRVEVRHIEPPFPQSPIEQRNFVADSKRYFEATGWKASYSLIQGIDETLRIIGDQKHI